MRVIARTATTDRIQAGTSARSDWRKLLLCLGAGSLLLYFALDLTAALRYDGYSYTGQTISELSAVGAPTRSLWIAPGLVYGVLTIAYGYGVWTAAGDRRSLRVVAGCISVIGILGLAAWPFAPMHQREVLAAGGGDLRDTAHLVLGGLDTLLFIASMAFGALAFGGRFRFYSLASILVVLLSGALTGLESGKVAADEATPWIGVSERIAVFGSMLWLAVFGIALLRDEEAS
jgi:hypothetical protein